MAEEFIGELPRDEYRPQFEAALRDLESNFAAAQRPLARVVIFGGHPRDESELGPRLADCGPFEFRWKALEEYGREASKLVAHSLCCADAAIVITCRVSHEIMYSVKRYVQIYGLRYRCIAKSTPNALKATLSEMFPEFEVKTGAPDQ